MQIIGWAKSFSCSLDIQSFEAEIRFQAKSVGH